MSGIIGIDPGNTGAAVFMSPFIGKPVCLPWTEPMDWERFAELLSTDKYVCFIEQVSASGNMGVVSAFTFGGNYHAWGTALRIFNIPTVRILPVEWMDGLVESGLERSVRKTALHNISVEKYGKHRKDHADAYLIAEYGVTNYGRFFTSKKPSHKRSRARISVGF